MNRQNNILDSLELHATSVMYRDKAIIIRGKSGSGKSDLAIRLIDRGAALIGDDRITIQKDNNILYVLPHKKLVGKIEIRGLGIITVPYVSNIEMGMVVDLINEEADRLPNKATTQMLGADVPLIKINPFEESATLKVLYGFEQLVFNK